jgi:membrane protein DedA with SNARE-associated domain
MIEGAAILKFFSVYLITMVKFIAGPVLGYAAEFPFWITVLLSVAAPMTSVVIFTFFGEFLRERIFRRIIRHRKTFSSRSRRFVTIWKKYGVVGVALLMPIFLTPIGGTLLLVSAGTPRNQIITYMFVSTVAWAFIFTLFIYLLGTEFLPDIVVIPE